MRLLFRFDNSNSNGFNCFMLLQAVNSNINNFSAGPFSGDDANCATAKSQMHIDIPKEAKVSIYMQDDGKIDPVSASLYLARNDSALPSPYLARNDSPLASPYLAGNDCKYFNSVSNTVHGTFTFLLYKFLGHLSSIVSIFFTC